MQSARIPYPLPKSVSLMRFSIIGISTPLCKSVAYHVHIVPTVQSPSFPDRASAQVLEATLSVVKMTRLRASYLLLLVGHSNLALSGFDCVSSSNVALYWGEPADKVDRTAVARMLIASFQGRIRTGKQAESSRSRVWQPTVQVRCSQRVNCRCWSDLVKMPISTSYR